ncbi:MAG: phosphotransferase [Planctomycetota bacterium]|nr:phosphotransferase [Planctomycetota bacterium]
MLLTEANENVLVPQDRPGGSPEVARGVEGGDARLFQPPTWLWSRAGDVGWWVRDGWEGSLLDGGALRLEEWRREGRLNVVKTGPHRVVYRVDLPRGSVYVKHFLVPGLRSKLRQWLRRGKGRNEGRRAAELAAIGVPTITPIALGEQRKRSLLLENFLITHAIEGMVPLEVFVESRLPSWPVDRRAAVRQKLARALGALTARLHDAGFLHSDFHPGNLLVLIDADEQPRFAIIDLDALRSCRNVGWNAARDNLALLNHYFWTRSLRADRHRFLRAYFDARREPPRDPRRFARDVESATRAWAERLWRRWGRRCTGDNKYFYTMQHGRAWGVAARDVDPALLRTLLANPNAPLRDEKSITLKTSRTTDVADTTLEIAGRPTRVIYKRFNKKQWFDPFLTWFRPSRAWQAWQAGQHLSARAAPTPRNLVFIARLRPFRRDPLFWYLPHETYLVTLKDEHAVTLLDYTMNILPALDVEARRGAIDRLTKALAVLLRLLHERSLSDRDLKSSNILLVGDPAVEEPRLSLIDLVGVRLNHPLPRHRRVQNLARLQVSLGDVAGRTRTDALRFLRAYLPWGLSPWNDWKSLWRDVAAAGDAKRTRNEQRGRKLT